MTNDKPAFEVRPYGGEPFLIWADGRIEGFPPGVIVINRIPQLMADHAISFQRAKQRAE